MNANKKELLRNDRAASASRVAARDATDWAALAAMSDDDVARATRDDADWDDFADIDWSTVEVLPVARKTPISIRVDPEVLTFFKSSGPGYQKRINAVLRAYVEAVTASRLR